VSNIKQMKGNEAMVMNHSKSFGIKAKILMAVMAVMLSFGTFVTVLPTTEAAAATLSVEKLIYKLGQPIRISGSGYAGGEKIAIWLTSPSGKGFDAGYLNAVSDGSFTSFPIGGGDTDANNILIASGAGIWKVTVKGLASGQTAISAFGVVGPDFAVVPSQVDGRLFLALYLGVNFFPLEKVDLWVTFPSGNVIALPYTFANGLGKIPDATTVGGFFFTGPDGVYGVTARGRVSQTPVSVQFQVVTTTAAPS
jgi:hypothetical protein